MWTTRYRVIPPIGAVSAPLPPEIDRLRLISIVDSRFRAISAEGEKKPEVWRCSSPALSVARTFIARERFLLPA
ncbi:hypothetical protein BHE74_00020016 [Ensete ventricosum]|nr:hypothetical protein GW17_00025580 [Ensete ventricosum]RWW72191.1 hypothetical protein BHE74_00020016 [Ensete ventricosum]RZR79982.1 hypothetical protein BHM03_00005863 [Ensete ventricosum]